MTFAPFYTRQRKKLSQKSIHARGLIEGYILGNPGESYNTIKRVLNLSNGILSYHLSSLETEGVIKSERDGYLKRFYPAKGEATKDVIDLNKIQGSIYKLIEAEPGITQKKITEKLELKQQRVSYNIKLMIDARVIRVEKEGNKRRYYLVEEE